MGQLYFETILNGVQFGVFLFLIAAGLTLVFGIMNMVNLAHGSLFMMGAYIGSYIFQQTGSFALAIVVAIPFSLVLGIALEFLALRTLYARDHLDQVLATFGFILFFNQLVLRVFGATSQEFRLPDAINFPMPLFGFTYPSYRLIVIVVGLAVAAGLFLVIAKTRVGMLIRAGASNRPMVGALGVNIRVLFTLIFGIGAALAGLAGVMIGPIESVESGMGESKLILAFVVIVIGGIGSIRGAFIASIIVGLVEVAGRVFMKDILKNVPIGDLLVLIITMFTFIAIMMGKSRLLSGQVAAVLAIFALKLLARTELKESLGAPVGGLPISLADLLIVIIAAGIVLAKLIGKLKLEQSVVQGMAAVAVIKMLATFLPQSALNRALPEEFAQTAGPALASMSIYILMAFVLYFRPQGLFPARTG